jgi:membrane-bound lytic murein transglycosylase C
MTKLFIFISLVLFSFNNAIASSNYKDTSGFGEYKKQQKDNFKNYRKQIELEYSSYKREISKTWRNPTLSSQKNWVSYSKDNQSRSNVDFRNNSYTIEVIANNLKEAQIKMKERISYIAIRDTKQVIKTDPLQKRIQKIRTDNKIANVNQIKAKPILTTIVFDKSPTKKDLKKYVNKVVQNNKITIKQSKIPNTKVYKLNVKLPSDSKIRLSRIYKDDVIKNYKKFKLNQELLFAIMQTESDFNPFAKSHIPAYGLMQIVPRSAGRDVYNFLYHKDLKPSSTYLYDSSNNIEMGSAYLHILYYKYLKKIKDPQSRLYCTIAAYNTGAGNIAWAFTSTHNMNKAAPIINKMSSDEVYRHLMNNLKYDEPKHYLKRVTRRMPGYKKLYSNI